MIDNVIPQDAGIYLCRAQHLEHVFNVKVHGEKNRRSFQRGENHKRKSSFLIKQGHNNIMREIVVQ